jgi:hypothetical protein
MHSIEMRVDGVRVPEKELEKSVAREGKGRALLLERTFEIPPDKKGLQIVLQAINARGTRSLEKAVTFRLEPPQRQLFVLAMGISDYDDDELDLRYPSKDADDLIAFFRRQEGVFYTKVNVRRLVDGEVSLARVKKARDEFLLRASEQDTILVFVAGHGTRYRDGRVLVPHQGCYRCRAL